MNTLESLSASQASAAIATPALARSLQTVQTAIEDFAARLQSTQGKTEQQTANAPGQTASWHAPWLADTPDSAQYLHPATADTATRQAGKPDAAGFMRATGADFSTASSLLYGVMGSNQDYRNWQAIMAAPDPVQAARQATGAQYQSSLPYASAAGGFAPKSDQILAQSGPYAWLRVQQREGLWLLDGQGQALRQIPMNAPDILRASRDFGLDPAHLQGLADQMDAQGIAYRPGQQLAGSDHGVDLRDLARGGMGAAFDWTRDPLAHLKGPGAQAAVQANALLAAQLGLAPAGSATPAASAMASPASVQAPQAAAGASSIQKTLEQLLNQFQAALALREQL